MVLVLALLRVIHHRVLVPVQDIVAVIKWWLLLGYIHMILLVVLTLAVIQIIGRNIWRHIMKEMLKL
jgi:hypothetical protein